MEGSPAAVFAAHCARGELVLPVGADGVPFWPPSVRAVGWVPSAGRGTTYASCVVRSRDEEPRDLTLVDLDEGVRLLSRVVGGPVPIGTRVELAWEDDVPVFVPARPPADPAGGPGAGPDEGRR